MQNHIRIYTLGRLAIERDGQVLENFLSIKTALLFTYLAMHPREHARETLAALFWSETNDEQALKNLRTVLSSLRRQLDDVLDTSRKSIAIHEDATIWVDALALDAATSSHAAKPLDVLQEIASSYKGDFLTGVRIKDAEELDNWISETRYHLQRSYRQILYTITEQAREQSKAVLGLHYAHLLVAQDPLWEAAQRQLMLLLAANDRVSEALMQYEQLTRLLDTELGTTPDEETTRVYEQIRSGGAQPRRNAARQTIRTPNTLFVEPVGDIDMAERMLNMPQCRLLTIYGISGVGKSALSLQIGYQRQQQYSHGAYFIPLAETHSAHQIPLLVARTVGLEFSSNNEAQMIEAGVIDWLGSRELLLVLDNYEHLLPDTAFVERLLDEAPNVQIIITSQHPLNLYREWMLPLIGLQVPDADAAQPEQYEAVRLFDLMARKVNPRFNLADSLPEVIEICGLVDGLPLGIILAAGWTQFLPISRIVENMREGATFDQSYQRSAPARHQSIEMMLEYTWNTLNASEQSALMNLSIFDGDFELDTALHVCGVPLDVLIGLIQKSLVLKFDNAYRTHQLIRRYAHRKLFYSPEREALCVRYLNYYVHFLDTARQRNSHVHEYLMVVETHFAKLWNFGWMPRSFQPTYIVSISRYLMVYLEVSHSVDKPQIIDLLSSFATTTDKHLTAETQALLCLQIARLAQQIDDQQTTMRYLQHALHGLCGPTNWIDLCVACTLLAATLYRAERITATIAPYNDETEEEVWMSVFFNVAFLNLDMQDLPAAEDVFEQILAHTHQAGRRTALLSANAALAAHQADWTRAQARFTQASELLAGNEDRLFALVVLSRRLQLAIRQADVETAIPLLVEALTMAAATSDVALEELTAVCANLTAGSASAAVHAALASLPPAIRTHPRLAALLA